MPSVTSKFFGQLGAWVATAGGATGLTQAFEGTGLWGTRIGKNLSNGTPYWEWTGVFNELPDSTGEGKLSIPAGATITAINFDYDWNCLVYSTGAASTVGPAELRDEAGALLKTFSTSQSFSSTTEIATKAGTNQTGLSLPVASKIKLRVGQKPNTGSNNKAEVQAQIRAFVITIIYETSGPQALKLELSDTATFNESHGSADALPKADSQAVADSMTKAMLKALTGSETVSLAESLVRSSALARGDSVAPTDTQTRLWAALRAEAEQIVFSEALARALGISQAQAVTLTDVVLRRVSLGRAEAVGVEDALAKAWAAKLIATDALNATEVSTRSLAKAILDAANLTDEVALAKGRALAFEEGLKLSDSATIALGRTLLENIGLLDVLSMTLSRAFSDALGLSENLTRSLGLTLSDQVSLFDQNELAFLAGGEGILKVIEDAVGFIEQRESAVGKALGEQLASADTRANSFGLLLVEAISLADRTEGLEVIGLALAPAGRVNRAASGSARLGESGSINHAGAGAVKTPTTGKAL